MILMIGVGALLDSSLAAHLLLETHFGQRRNFSASLTPHTPQICCTGVCFCHSVMSQKKITEKKTSAKMTFCHKDTTMTFWFRLSIDSQCSWDVVLSRSKMLHCQGIELDGQQFAAWVGNFLTEKANRTKDFL